MSEPHLPTPLVTVDWLAAHRDEEDLVVLDASWHVPATARDGRAEWRERRIPGARFFDYDRTVVDRDSPLPRMMPPAAVFEAEVGRLGIDDDSRVVVYDTNGLFAAPRAWWMFRAMGHDAVAVLDGGLQAWEAAGLPVETAPPVEPTPARFRARPRPGAFVDAQRVLQALAADGERVLDARSSERFRAAHMPGAASRPYSDLLRDGHMKSPDELRALFAGQLRDEQELICSCGSGVTACVLALGASLAGHRGGIAVYDGSWSEWGARGDLPVVQDEGS